MILIKACLILFYFFSPLIFYVWWSIFLLLLVKWQLWRKLELGALHTLIFYHYKSINTRERKKIKDVMPINYSYTPPQNRELLFFIALSSLIYLFLIYCSWVSKYPSIWILIHSQPWYSKIAQFTTTQVAGMLWQCPSHLAGYRCFFLKT